MSDCTPATSIGKGKLHGKLFLVFAKSMDSLAGLFEVKSVGVGGELENANLISTPPSFVDLKSAKSRVRVGSSSANTDVAGYLSILRI